MSKIGISLLLVTAGAGSLVVYQRWSGGDDPGVAHAAEPVTATTRARGLHQTPTSAAVPAVHASRALLTYSREDQNAASRLLPGQGREHARE